MPMGPSRIASTYAEVRITMYFGNSTSAGPYRVSVPARGTLERADSLGDALLEAGELVEATVVRVRR